MILIHHHEAKCVKNFERYNAVETLKITVDDQETKELVVRMLHLIKGVNIQEQKRTVSPNPATALKELAGIWVGRDVTLSGLREKAWRRGSAI